MVPEKKSKATPVYVRSDENCWVPALQLKTYNGKATVSVPVFKTEQNMLGCGKASRKQRYNENQIVELKHYPGGALPLQNVDSNGSLQDFKDMVDLPFMHEAAILYNLKLRHIREKPYTRTGDIVIAVNPYQWYYELYTEEKRGYYANRLVWEQSKEDPRAAMEPHVYEVSALAYKGLAFGEGEDQSILVSGESGAGKTETVKICLNHIALTQRGAVPPGYYQDRDETVERIVQSNPLLEAFGNAKTRRNDNSSRFGKYLQLQFDKDAGKATHGFKSTSCGLVGSRCDVYLLEKNRVVGHDQRERTFHIFYQLLAAPDSEKNKYWEGLAGASNESFKYVGHTKTHTIEGKNDAERFGETLDALALVGVKGEKLDTLMKAICVVLQCGNLTFAAKGGDSDMSSVSSLNDMKALSALMGVSERDLELAFTERTFKTKRETHKVPLTAEAAKEACDALAKEIYQKTFLWLVSAINTATGALVADGKKYGTIGLLDIFGFEQFPTNRFEQLCINYANEKLQQKFTEDVFRSVQEEYEAEGVPLGEISYADNADVLDLIEGRTGLLALLNEECVRPKGNDFEFVQKALKINKASSVLIVHRTDRLSFGIQHYAGAVMYDAETFVSKNLDTLPTDLQEAAEKCSNSIINKKASKTGSFREQADRNLSNIVAPTVWTKYKSQLSTLMGSLRMTKSRYIRCIKPNTAKKPVLMEHSPTVEQLRCAGVVAAVTLTRSVFPNRLPNSIVLARYSNMWDHEAFPSQRTRKMTQEEKRSEDCKALMNCVLKHKELLEDGKRTQAFVVGKTKTYFREGALEYLESNRMANGLDDQATTIQSAARGWLARHKGKYDNQQKKAEEAQKDAAKRASAARKAEMAKEQAERAKDRKQAENKLLEEISMLEEALMQAERDHVMAVSASQDRAAKAKRNVQELEERCAEEENHNAKARKIEKVQQESQIEEAAKLIMMLKKENKKLNKEHQRIQTKFDQATGLNEKIDENSFSLAESVDLVGEEASNAAEQRGSLSELIDDAKAINKTAKSKVVKQQTLYMDQAEGRLKLQKALAKIMASAEDKVDDKSVLEDILGLALGAESAAKCILAGLDLETSQPSLAGSDTSEMSYESDNSESY